MISFDSIVYTINDFWEWDSRDELVLSPKFQRRSVWSEKAKSYLIDTVIRGLPISKIFMHHDVNLETRKSIREIVDGQQRIQAILLFLRDGFKVSKVHNKECGGKYFAELPKETRRAILQFKISVDIIHGTETQILDIFARLNTYTVKLNAQELLNAKYFGAFKQTVYLLGYEFKDFWVNNRVMTERDVARMGEAQLASELAILILSGIQDRKAIATYYDNYDDNFKEAGKITRAFRQSMEDISQIFDGRLKDSGFRKKPLFYSLVGVLGQLRKTHQLKAREFPKIFSALAEIDEILASDPDSISPKYFKFYGACTKHVTDLAARKIRHKFILNFVTKRTS